MPKPFKFKDIYISLNLFGPGLSVTVQRRIWTGNFYRQWTTRTYTPSHHIYKLLKDALENHTIFFYLYNSNVSTICFHTGNSAKPRTHHEPYDRSIPQIQPIHQTYIEHHNDFYHTRHV